MKLRIKNKTSFYFERNLRDNVSMKNLLNHLNPEQLAAVTLPKQSALILAGAGSGKTRVLTARIAWLLKTAQISPANVLAVTFTNKAAKEMILRISSYFPINARNMWIGTFHGLCNRLLRFHFKEAGLSQAFQILDAQDQMSFTKRLLKAHQINDDLFPARKVVYFINQAKEDGLRATDMTTLDSQERQLIEIYSLYEQQCQKEGVVDFAELLLRSYELLLRNQLLREHYQNRFQHILVDEFQDTNDLQYRWLKLLAGENAAIFAVGDDDQSIYAFRGANVENMRLFQSDFKVKNLIRLEQNYRSYANILDAANELIGHNLFRLGKNLRTDAGHGELIRVYEAQSDQEEARYIVEEIKNLIQTEGIARSDIAVLYRSNAQSRVIEHTLFSAGIAYRVYGGLRFFERAEVKNAVAYLQLLNHPQNDSAFLRVVNFPARGIGARSLEQLQDIAKEHNTSLYEAVTHLKGKASKNLMAFVDLIEMMRFETQQMPLPELVQYVIAKSGMKLFYQTEKDGLDRLENLEQLAQAADVFLQEEHIDHDTPAFFVSSELTHSLGGETEVIEMSPLVAFLTHASLEAGEHHAKEGQDALQLMTVHAAKGLEFYTVFITGLEEGLFPHDNSLQEKDGLEEERRLMYVAITRAKTRLYLTLSSARYLMGKVRHSVRSRFLNELPKQTLKWLTSPHEKELSYDSSQVVSSQKNLPWSIGQNVSHARFGDGVIVDIEVFEKQARALINFGANGMKLLDLSVAKLTALS